MTIPTLLRVVGGHTKFLKIINSISMQSTIFTVSNQYMLVDEYNSSDASGHIRIPHIVL